MLEEGIQRYLTGRDMLLLMGLPLHQRQMDCVSDSAAWPSGLFPNSREVLHDLAGNTIHMRSIGALICAAFAATKPEMMSGN